MPRKPPQTAAQTKTANLAAASRDAGNDVAPAKPPGGSAGAKVTVACKLPGGLILRLHTFVDTPENVAGNNVKMVKIARPHGEPVLIKGNATPHGIQKPLVGGYMLTPNVDKDFFEEWMRQNKDHDAVKNGLIFAHEKRDSIEGIAEENAEKTSGMEPLDMTMVTRGETKVPKDPRVGRPVSANVSAISPDTEKAKAA